MDTQITAIFDQFLQLERTVEELRSQEVLDLRVRPVGTLPNHIQASPVGLTEGLPIAASTTRAGYSIEVFVERSRARKAEDTILRCGGKIISSS